MLGTKWQKRFFMLTAKHELHYAEKADYKPTAADLMGGSTGGSAPPSPAAGAAAGAVAAGFKPSPRQP